MSDKILEGADAATNFANSIVLMKEINRLLFLERFEKEFAPGIAKELKRLGVKFP